MKALVRSGNWDFAITPATPPVGCVLLWLTGSTHSAVVTAANQITGHTTAGPPQLAANQRLCVVIAEDTIVGRAAALDL